MQQGKRGAYHILRTDTANDSQVVKDPLLSISDGRSPDFILDALSIATYARSIYVSYVQYTC